MKKLFSLFLVVFLISFAQLPVSAVTTDAQWPPKPYEGVPKIVYTDDSLKNMEDSIKSSMKSIGSTGLNMLAPFIPITFIVLCVGEVLRVRMKFNRDVKAIGYRHKVQDTWTDLNHDVVINEKVKNKELNILATQKFREIHPDYDEDEMERRFNIMQLIRKRHAKGSNQILEDMEHRYSLMEIIKKRHKKSDQQIISEREHRRQINHKDLKQNLDSIVEDRMQSIMVNAAAQERFRERFPEYETDEIIRRSNLHDQARILRKNRMKNYYGNSNVARKPRHESDHVTEVDFKEL